MMLAVVMLPHLLCRSPSLTNVCLCFLTLLIHQCFYVTLPSTKLLVYYSILLLKLLALICGKLVWSLLSSLMKLSHRVSLMVGNQNSWEVLLESTISMTSQRKFMVLFSTDITESYLRNHTSYKSCFNVERFLKVVKHC